MLQKESGEDCECSWHHDLNVFYRVNKWLSLSCYVTQMNNRGKPVISSNDCQSWTYKVGL